MVYRRRRILLTEVDRQCRFAMIAYGDACTALEKRDAERCWYSLQSLIAAATQLHRLLWPPPDGSPEWAMELRNALEVAEDSPLNHRQLASVLDITATIETWSAPRASQFPVAPRLSSGSLVDPAVADFVRCFDPETGTLTLFGNMLELPPLLNAIADLGQKAESEQQHLREVV